MPITALYASLLVLFYVYLSFRVFGAQREARVETAPGPNPDLLRQMRLHTNFIEYVPFAIILIGLAESLKAPPGLLHGLGATLVAARLIHAYGQEPTSGVLKLRMLGVTLTFAVLMVAALACFGLGLLQALI